jgi:hypothetical protein
MRLLRPECAKRCPASRELCRYIVWVDSTSCVPRVRYSDASSFSSRTRPRNPRLRELLCTVCTVPHVLYVHKTPTLGQKEWRIGSMSYRLLRPAGCDSIKSILVLLIRGKGSQGKLISNPRYVPVCISSVVCAGMVVETVSFCCGTLLALLALCTSSVC